VTTTDTAPGAATRLKELTLGLAYAAMLQTATRLGVADAIGDEPATIEQIAARVGADAPTLARVMRGLITQGVYEQTSDGRYINNEMSALTRRGTADSMADMVLWAGAAWTWDAWPLLGEAVKTGQPVVPGLYGKDFFTYLREDGGEDAQVFNRAMTQSSSQNSRAVARALDIGAAKTLVDIGGGQGHLLRTLLLQNEDLYGTLFDLPTVTEVAVPELREGGALASRATFVPGNCLEAVPVEADIYLIKQVLKWDFESSVKVLQNIKAAARPGARIVVVQNLIDDTPEPAYAAAMDLLLLLNVGGREHTTAEFEMLFRRAGLTFTGVTPTSTSLRLIEARV
jgi:C-methyltransferase